MTPADLCRPPVSQMLGEPAVEGPAAHAGDLRELRNRGAVRRCRHQRAPQQVFGRLFGDYRLVGLVLCRALPCGVRRVQDGPVCGVPVCSRRYVVIGDEVSAGTLGVGVFGCGDEELPGASSAPDTWRSGI